MRIQWSSSIVRRALPISLKKETIKHYILKSIVARTYEAFAQLHQDEVRMDAAQAFIIRRVLNWS